MPPAAPNVFVPTVNTPLAGTAEPIEVRPFVVSTLKADIAPLRTRKAAVLLELMLPVPVTVRLPDSKAESVLRVFAAER